MAKFKFSNADTSAICSSLSYLLQAGVLPASALTVMAEDEKRISIKKILQDMAANADGGMKLSETFRVTACFDEFVFQMISAGEQSGRLKEALDSIADSCEKKANLDRQMKSSLIYPAVLLLIMLGVIAVLLIYVMPVFDNVYAQLGGSLTGVAGSLLALGEILGSVLPLVIAVFALAVALLVWFSVSNRFRDKVLNAFWNCGRENSVMTRVNRSRFARELSMAIQSGMDIEKAIQIASEIPDVKGDVKAKGIQCLEKLQAGEKYASALAETGLLPAAECRILEAGVHSGNSDQAIEKIADRLASEADNALDESLARVEPAIIIISSVLTGLILISVMLPLLNMMSVIA